MGGRTGPGRVPDAPGGRRHLGNAVMYGRTGNRVGGGGGVAGLDGKVRRAAGALYGLEKRLRARANGEGVVARKVQPDAVWTDVRATGNQDYCGRIAGGQGSGGAQSWHASGPLGEEAAAQEDRHAWGGESIPGDGVLRRSQPAIRHRCGVRGGLSSAAARRQATARYFPFGDRAGSGERLGGTA